MTVKSVEYAIALRMRKGEIGTNEIMKLFGCSRSCATRLKKPVREYQYEHDIKVFTHNAINTRAAYAVWGIDVDELSESLTRLRKLKLENVAV